MRGRIIFVLGVFLLAVALVRHPTADIRIVTHDVGDPAPRKIEAAVDIGLFALNLLVTWTAKGLAPR